VFYFWKYNIDVKMAKLISLENAGAEWLALFFFSFSHRNDFLTARSFLVVLGVT
jgi:hypothetical protein